jgi:hypothetical protein
MSKQVKIVIGVVAIVVLLGCFLVGLTGFAVSRSWNFRTMTRPPQSATQLEVRLLDDDEDGIPDRALAALPGPAFNRSRRFNQGFSGQGSQLDVRLIDDDGDGVPDRGVLDIPAGPGFEPRFDSSRTFGRRFEPSWDQDRFTSRRFTPFVILGGLFRLAILATVLAGLVVLGVVLFRHWRNPSPSPAAPEGITPPETEAEATEAPPADQEEEAAPASSAEAAEVEPELDTAEGEGIEPEEDQPDK